MWLFKTLKTLLYVDSVLPALVRLQGPEWLPLICVAPSLHACIYIILAENIGAYGVVLIVLAVLL